MLSHLIGRRRRTRPAAVLGIVAALWLLQGWAGAAAPPSASVALSGIVRDARTMRAIPGVRVVVTSGPDAGAFTISDERGAFAFPRLAAGIVDLEGTKDGYTAERIQSLDIERDAAIEFPMRRAPVSD